LLSLVVAGVAKGLAAVAVRVDIETLCPENHLVQIHQQKQNYLLLPELLTLLQ
jgi:hypothetical protein